MSSLVFEPNSDILQYVGLFRTVRFSTVLNRGRNRGISPRRVRTRLRGSRRVRNRVIGAPQG